MGATITERDGRRPTAGLIATPDRRRRLADGLVVEASIVARLFRFRLLSIDAGLIVSPARVTARPAAVPPSARPPAIGAGLVTAQRCLDEGVAQLAASRGLSPGAPRRRHARSGA